MNRLRYGEKNDVYDFGVILLEIIVGRMIVSEHDVGVSKDIVSFLSSTRLSIALNYYNHNLSLILKSLGSSTQSLFSF